MQVSKISVSNCQPRTNSKKFSYVTKNDVVSNKILQADECSFKSNKAKTAAGLVCAFGLGALGFLVAGPVGAIGGAALGGAGGYSMESEDGTGSDGDSNYYDKRD